ncbi:13571_t:CDS:2, partial [Ambispora gerdemannii]
KVEQLGILLLTRLDCLQEWFCATDGDVSWRHSHRYNGEKGKRIRLVCTLRRSNNIPNCMDMSDNRLFDD